MSKKIENMLIFAGSTLGSRFLGLIRDILMYSMLGLSGLNSAFIMAFTLPNLFRRLMGEGALTSAFLPVLSQSYLRGGDGGVWSVLNALLRRLIPALCVLMAFLLLLLGAASIWGMESWEPRYQYAVKMGMLLLPYLALVCLAAIFGVVLQVMNRFALIGLSPVWLNISMIVCLGGLGPWCSDDVQVWAWFLCAGVLLGGVLQCMVPLWALWRSGWSWRGHKASSNEEMREVWLLFLPGVGGAAIVQLNILFSRVLAFSLEDAAVAILYLANRLVEFPLGVFGIAVTTVVFPQLARFRAAGDMKGFSMECQQGLLLLALITFPATVGLMVLATPILTAGFAWGAFQQGGVEVTVPILQVLALSIPAYSVNGFLTRVFHSMKDMQTPLRVAVWSFAINMVASVSLMWLWGVWGLALANVIAAYAQSYGLYRGLGRHDLLAMNSGWEQVLRMLLATVVMAVAVLATVWGVEQLWSGSAKALSALQVVLAIVCGCLVYAACAYALRIACFFEAWSAWRLRRFA